MISQALELTYQTKRWNINLHYRRNLNFMHRCC
jgi:hypothetical protein